MALLAALVEVLKMSKSRTLLTLPFPETLQSHNTFGRNTTVCTMLVHEKKSISSCCNLPLYTLKQGLHKTALGIQCGLLAGIEASTMRRAKQIQESLSRNSYIPVIYNMNQLSGVSFGREDRQYLRNFLVSS